MKRYRIILFFAVYSLIFVFLSLFLSGIFLKMNNIDNLLSMKKQSPAITPADPVDTMIARMSEREKIGQLLMINFYGTNIEKVSRFLETNDIGGVMLNSDNISAHSIEGIKKQNEALQQSSPRIPLFISVDQEGGTVSRLRDVLKDYPSIGEIYKKQGKSGVEEEASYYSRELKNMDFNVNFSPVVDVIKNSNSIVAERSISKDPEKNALVASLYLRIFQKHNLIAVPKHFPGYGTVSGDPHFETCTDNQSEFTQLALPFRSLLNAPMIMSSHVIFKKTDDVPATLSSKILGWLRKQNYSNIVISDDIQMKSITDLYDYKKASLLALNAGCDIVLSITKDEKQWKKKAEGLYNYLLKAYKNGSLKHERVNQSLHRILSVKWGYLKNKRWTILPDFEKQKLSTLENR